MHIDAMDARKKIENVKNDAICHVTRQNQYNPAGGGATIIISAVIGTSAFLLCGRIAFLACLEYDWWHCHVKYIYSTCIIIT